MDVGSHKRPAPRKKNDFIIADYKFVEGDSPDVKLPTAAPCAGDSGGCCRVGHHSIRHRKSGPCHGLVVVRCATHKRFFTLYPPGFAPYLRQSLEPEAGSSVFLAASDGADGRAWPRGRLRGADQCWRTQTRQIMFAGVILGLMGMNVAVPLGSDIVAQVLEVPLHVHRQAVEEFATGGYQSRGRAVMRALGEVHTSAGRRSRSGITHLYEAGFVTGTWGRAWRVVQVGDVALLHPVFRV